MIALFDSRFRIPASLLFAGLGVVVPSVGHAASGELATPLPQSEGTPDAAISRPAVVIFARAMDLAGTPMSMVPKGGLIIGSSGKGRAWVGQLVLPSATPFSLGYLSSGFGIRGHPILGGQRLHAGLDFATPTGSPVYATMDGLVSTAGWAGGYGLSVRLTNGESLETRYGHLSRIAVASGSVVRKGELVGFTGSTGMSTGPHLHYEVRVNGRPVDPRGLLRK